MLHLVDATTPSHTVPLRSEVGRNELRERDTTISRVQFTLRQNGPTALLLESRGSKPTGIRKAGSATWVWLNKDESMPLALGDCIALSQKLTPGTMLTLRRSEATATRRAPSAATRRRTPVARPRGEFQSTRARSTGWHLLSRDHHRAQS